MRLLGLSKSGCCRGMAGFLPSQGQDLMCHRGRRLPGASFRPPPASRCCDGRIAVTRCFVLKSGMEMEDDPKMPTSQVKPGFRCWSASALVHINCCHGVALGCGWHSLLHGGGHIHPQGWHWKDSGSLCLCHPTINPPQCGWLVSKTSERSLLLLATHTAGLGNKEPIAYTRNTPQPKLQELRFTGTSGQRTSRDALTDGDYGGKGSC